MIPALSLEGYFFLPCPVYLPYLGGRGISGTDLRGFSIGKTHRSGAPSYIVHTSTYYVLPVHRQPVMSTTSLVTQQNPPRPPDLRARRPSARVVGFGGHGPSRGLPLPSFVWMTRARRPPAPRGHCCCKLPLLTDLTGWVSWEPPPHPQTHHTRWPRGEKLGEHRYFA